MKTKRPFINLGIKELQDMFDSSILDRKILNQLSRELANRSTSKAKSLRIKVKAALDDIENEKATTTSEADFPPNSKIVFSCHTCQTKIRLNNDTANGTFRCATCKSLYKISNKDNLVEIIFQGQSPSDTPENKTHYMSIKDAYQILGCSPGDSLNTIKEKKRILIQQYHPDKVSQLGSKLKDLALIEAQNINKAFDLIKNSL